MAIFYIIKIICSCCGMYCRGKPRGNYSREETICGNTTQMCMLYIVQIEIAHYISIGLICNDFDDVLCKEALGFVPMRGGGSFCVNPFVIFLDPRC